DGHSVKVPQGSCTVANVAVFDYNGFSGTVCLSATGLPTGVTVAFGENPSSAGSTITFTAAHDAPLTSHPALVVIKGVGQGIEHAVVTYVSVVSALPDFDLTVSPQPITVVQGSNGSGVVEIDVTNGFSDQVTFDASGLPAGMSATFGTNPA